MGNNVVIKSATDIDVIKNRIYEVRGQRVMLDRNLNVMLKGSNSTTIRNAD